MNNTIKFLVKKENNFERLDVFLSKKISYLTRSYIKKIIEQNNVKINNNVISSPSKKIKNNDKIDINLIVEKSEKLLPKKIKLNILFEDKDVLIVNKPKGMVVHPGAGNYTDTLANALLYKYKKKLSNINGDLKPGIVHRIDKATSGLLVIAKNNSSFGTRSLSL